MKNKKTIEDQINEFVKVWDVDSLINLFDLYEKLRHLYDVTEEDDWLEKIVGLEDRRNVRVVRTIYILSKLSQCFSGKMAITKINFPNLWKKLENVADETMLQKLN